MLRAVRGFLAGLLLCALPGAANTAPLTVGVRGYLVQHEVFSLFARPGETLVLDLPHYDTNKLQLYLDGTAYGKASSRSWQFAAPMHPGLYEIRISHLETHARSTFKLFVGVPATAADSGRLNDYRIGPPPPGNSQYPLKYAAPEIFIEVTAQNRNTRVSPHFTLGQFLCKQESDFPKYVVLQESLLVLLEGLIAAVQLAGYPVETFGVISAYRTPYYNKRIGNVANSRHVYGDAMDFFVDSDGDGRMDDLNGDSQHDRADIDLLHNIVEAFKRQTDNAALIGGVGRYYQASHHGGFIHVDTRGYRARW